MKKLAALLFGALVVSLIAGCSAEISDSGDSSSEYGSIVIKSDARAAEFTELKSAVITVSGYGMDEVSETVSFSGGSGNVTVEKVKTGKNRVVKVQSNVTGFVLYELIDEVKSGDNTIDQVTWTTTPLGAVFYNLIKAGVDVSSIMHESVAKWQMLFLKKLQKITRMVA